MTCKDFQRRWDELLDAEAGSSPASKRAIDQAEILLLTHAAECPTCRPIALRYQTLRHSIRAWRRPPEPPADLVRRVLSAPADRTPATPRHTSRLRRGFWRERGGPIRQIAAVAALALVMGLVMVIALPAVRRRQQPPVVIGNGPVDRHPGPLRPDEERQAAPPALDRALAEASSATWELALSASEPAARIGREMLGATALGDEGAPGESGEDLVDLSVALPSLGGIGADVPDTSAVLEQVGDQLSAGVRPLSSTARHAFGFLLGAPAARPVGSTPSGARSG